MARHIEGMHVLHRTFAECHIPYATANAVGLGVAKSIVVVIVLTAMIRVDQIPCLPA